MLKIPINKLTMANTLSLRLINKDTTPITIFVTGAEKLITASLGLAIIFVVFLFILPPNSVKENFEICAPKRSINTMCTNSCTKEAINEKRYISNVSETKESRNTAKKVKLMLTSVFLILNRTYSLI